jgi:hypothetical protein
VTLLSDAQQLAASALHSELAAQICEREEAHGWEREPVEDPRSLVRAGLLEKVKRAWCGQDGRLTILDDRRKLLPFTQWPLSDGDLARQYLRSTLEPWQAEAPPKSLRRKRIPFNTGAAVEFMGYEPSVRYFEPPAERGGPWAHVDIEACYPSLYFRGGPVMEYRPWWSSPVLRVVGPRFERQAEWLLDKGPRSAVWGMVRSAGIPELRFGQPGKISPNKFCSPDLVGYLLDTVNAIAAEAIERWPSICMWVVDAAIMRPDDAREFVLWLSERWGLVATIDVEGPGYVWGYNCWTIANVSKGAAAFGMAHNGPALSSVRQLASEHRELLAAFR